MNEEVLENIYRENLEERIMAYLTETQNLSYETAMDLYYNSKLSDKIHMGKEGIQYLDYKAPVQILLETEEELLNCYRQQKKHSEKDK